jgi:hypothetical protein
VKSRQQAVVEAAALGIVYDPVFNRKSSADFMNS